MLVTHKKTSPHNARKVWKRTNKFPHFLYLCNAIPRDAHPEGIPRASRRHPEGTTLKQNKKQGKLWQE